MSQHPVKDIRELKNVSQDKLAHALGVSVAVFNQMELENLFNTHQLMLLASELRVDVNKLSGFENEITSLLNQKTESNTIKFSDVLADKLDFFFEIPDDNKKDN